MELFIGSFILIGLSCAGLALGLLLGRKPLQGTCASLSGLNKTCPRGLTCEGHCRRLHKDANPRPGV